MLHILLLLGVSALPTEHVPVVIIGGGVSGLCCARKCVRAGTPAVVLEAGDAVGGRVRTDSTPDGFLLDHGFQANSPAVCLADDASLTPCGVACTKHSPPTQRCTPRAPRAQNMSGRLAWPQERGEGPDPCDEIFLTEIESMLCRIELPPVRHLTALV